jgi:Spy/CpxP family protein refolding chaperone
MNTTPDPQPATTTPSPRGPRRWIKRTLIALVAGTAVFGALAAWAWHGHGWRHHGWQQMSEADATRLRDKAVDRIAGKLDLDAAQRTRLVAVADAVIAQQRALMATAPAAASPRAEVQALIAGQTFDRAGAQRLVDSKLQAVTTRSPAVLAAFGDFYDGLRPEQQAQVRDWLARGRHHGGERRGG